MAKAKIVLEDMLDWAANQGSTLTRKEFEVQKEREQCYGVEHEARSAALQHDSTIQRLSNELSLYQSRWSQVGLDEQTRINTLLNAK